MITINKKEIYVKNVIAKSFNDYFANVGSNLQSRTKTFEKKKMLKRTNPSPPPKKKKV